MLVQAANLLVAIEAQYIPQKLLRNLTVAAMKGSKHLALLGMVPDNSSGMHLAVILRQHFLLCQALVRVVLGSCDRDNFRDVCVGTHWCDVMSEIYLCCCRYSSSQRMFEGLRGDACSCSCSR